MSVTSVALAVESWFGQMVVATSVSFLTASSKDVASTPFPKMMEQQRSAKDGGKLDSCMDMGSSGTEPGNIYTTNSEFQAFFVCVVYGFLFHAFQ